MNIRTELLHHEIHSTFQITSKTNVLKKYQSCQEYKNISKTHRICQNTMKFKVRKCGTVNLPGSGHDPKLTEGHQNNDLLKTRSHVTSRMEACDRLKTVCWWILLSEPDHHTWEHIYSKENIFFLRASLCNSTGKLKNPSKKDGTKEGQLENSSSQLDNTFKNSAKASLQMTDYNLEIWLVNLKFFLKNLYFYLARIH